MTLPVCLQGKLDVGDEQKRALQQAHHKYRSELHAMATERKSLNAVLAAAAAPGKSDSIKKVLCTSSMQLCFAWLALLYTPSLEAYFRACCHPPCLKIASLLPLPVKEHLSDTHSS